MNTTNRQNFQTMSQKVLLNNIGVCSVKISKHMVCFVLKHDRVIFRSLQGQIESCYPSGVGG